MSIPPTDLSYLPFHRPDIGEEEVEAVSRVLRSGWLTTGAECQRFEEEFGAFVQARHALALNSCTAALHLALAVLDLKPGDEVVLPTMTFAATAEVVRYFQAVPVLCDILPTLNMNPEDVERKISPRTRAVIAVHMAGQPADLESLREICRRHGLPLIEDAAHSLPAYWRGRPVGCDSQLACFSFYATKNLTTGEGGLLVTDNEDWAQRARRLSLHGISHDAWKRYSAAGSWYYEIVEPGYKYNLTDIQAALGRVQLRRQPELWARRRELVRGYQERLEGDPRFQFPEIRPDVASAWHLIIVQLADTGSPDARNQVMDKLRSAGIGASVHFIPLHLHPYYRDGFGYRPESLPAATRAYYRSLSLPLYPSLRDDDLDRICDALRQAVRA